MYAFCWCTPSDFQTRSFPTLQSGGYLFITHVRAYLVGLGVDGDDVPVCPPPRTRSPCVSKGIIRTEEALCPSRSRNICVVVWPGKRNGNRRKPSLASQDGDWTTHLGFRHYVACFQSYCCIFDNLKSGDPAREGVRSYPTDDKSM